MLYKLIQIKLDFPTFLDVMIKLAYTPFFIGASIFYFFQVISDDFFPIIYNTKRSINLNFDFLINLTQTFDLIFKNLVDKSRKIFKFNLFRV